jgi:hypothetical protein
LGELKTKRIFFFVKRMNTKKWRGGDGGEKSSAGMAKPY